MAFGASGAFNFSLPTPATTSTGTSLLGSLPQPKTTVASTGFNFGAPSGNFTLGSAASSAPSGGLFNLGTATATSTSTTGGGFNFGTAIPSSAGSSGTALFAATTSASASVLNLSTVPATPSTASSVSFALPNPSSSSAPNLGSFSFATNSATAAGQNLTNNPSAAPSLFSLPTSNQPTSLPTPLTLALSSASPAPVSSAATSSLNFGKPVTTSSTLLPSSSSGFSLGNSSTTSQPGNLLSAPSLAASLSTATTTSSSFSAPGVLGPPNLSMRQLEERLNKWLVELKEQEERFIRQAAHVNEWDQVLQNGHDQVQALKDTVHTVKSDQSRLEAELDFIRGQQDELERLLDPLESAVSATPGSQMHQGDRQRDNMYHLAQNLDGQLRQMTDDLGKVIDHLNSSSASVQPNDPVSLVARILSAHMDTLKWVDHNTALLSQKTEQVSKISAETTLR